MKVFDLLSSEIHMDDGVATTLPSNDNHLHDWTQQNTIDAEQQAEIDALKAEIEELKSASTTPTETTGGAVRRTNSYSRMFNYG